MPLTFLAHIKAKVIRTMEHWIINLVLGTRRTVQIRVLMRKRAERALWTCANCTFKCCCIPFSAHLVKLYNTLTFFNGLYSKRCRKPSVSNLHSRGVVIDWIRFPSSIFTLQTNEVPQIHVVLHIDEMARQNTHRQR